MYRDKGKNYWISTEWGNDAFGHTGTRGMVQLTYNLINRIVFVPGYDTEQYQFPPTMEMIAVLEHNPRTMAESRIYAFWQNDLIFFGSEKHKNQLIPLVYHYPSENNGIIEERKLVCCLDPATFRHFTGQLRGSQDRIYRDKKSDFPFPLREDVIDIEVYRFIDTIIRENGELLPAKFRRSLELENYSN